MQLAISPCLWAFHFLGRLLAPDFELFKQDFAVCLAFAIQQQEFHMTKVHVAALYQAVLPSAYKAH